MCDKTLQDTLIRSGNRKDRGITFIEDKDKSKVESYEQLFINAKRILGFLQKEGITKGSKLIFQIKDNFEFMNIFWACILGGIIAVPVVCDDKKEFLHKVFRIQNKLKNSFVICDQDRKEMLIKFGQENGYLSDELALFIDKNKAVISNEKEGKITSVKEDDIAFIQFSSGSTGNPKGIVLTHENLVTNIKAITNGVSMTEDDRLVYWLPLTHDMGIIGCHITLVYNMANQYIMPTNLFIYKPLLWLEKISKYKSTMLVVSDFGMQFVTSALKKKTVDYDLSSVRFLLNGAEPISVKVCKEFIKKLKSCGFKESALFPVYGMAEATLAISFPKLGEGMSYVAIEREKLNVGEKVCYTDEENKSASLFVEEGTNVQQMKFRICDKKDKVLDEETFGYIQIKGKSVTRGYYNAEDSIGSWTEDQWFKTGDMGFVHNENIVVVGREKEMLIVNGYNYFSSDLERIATKIPEIRSGKIIVTDVYDRNEMRENLAAFISSNKGMDEFVKVSKELNKLYRKELGIAMDYILPVKSISKTSSGKVIRYDLKKKFESGGFNEIINEIKQYRKDLAVTSQSDFNKGYLIDEIVGICREEVQDFSLNADSDIHDAGVNSSLIMKIYAAISRNFENALEIEDLFTCRTIGEIADRIYNKTHIENKNDDISIKIKRNTDEIAIIGMSLKLPGAETTDEFWENLVNGSENIGTIPKQRRKEIEKYYEFIGKENVQYIKGGYLKDISNFDHKFFGVIDREAIAMSPVQRLYLENVYNTMEDAGYGGDKLVSTNTGVFTGYIGDLKTQQYQEILKTSRDAASPTGSLSANISGRVSYTWDFGGPSVLVDSACSSSFSALNMACNALKQGVCEQALVGGVQLNILPEDNHRFGVESGTGHMYPFDEKGDGLCESEGVVTILIKPLSKAVEDKDNIYAVISACESNQDGRSIGLSAPHPDKQTALVKQALSAAGISQDKVMFIETHGTATKLADPIELNVLAKIFQSSNDSEKKCYCGAVKANIGHTYAAAGLVSLVKCCCMIQHKVVPPLFYFENLNQSINLNGSRLALNKKREKLENEIYCAINNFGFSGTNCHVILRQYENKIKCNDSEDKRFPFVVSAPTEGQLIILIGKYIEFFTQNREINIRDVSYTVCTGRGVYKYRACFVVGNIGELIEKLKIYNGTNDNENDILVGVGKTHRELKENLKIEKPDIRLKYFCQLYVDGYHADWIELFEKEALKKCSLPTFVYNKKYFWPSFM